MEEGDGRRGKGKGGKCEMIHTFHLNTCSLQTIHVERVGH